MGGRSVLCAAVALLATACGTAASPEAAPDPAPPTSAAPTPTPTPRTDELSRSGARADVPDVEIMAQLARRAERIAKNLPQAPIPADVDRGSNRALGYQLMIEFGFPEEQWAYLDALWHRESGWNHLAENPSSGAYGIPQSLPGTKMAVVGSDWRTNPETQINWGLAYIGARYGTPQKAWAHSEAVGWY
ncbi:transglycosylase SLT domain-containing protein [Nocardioides aromaticivorans]|uniref:aggregation-promoting factor C-terminal-like domain-containing protein n=1 Tax=Nocardioides aromaticivorans TaxID=200618 RepID=UPI00068B6565|nr:transglycosylase SLT domain-containing protein [Nocardioides aromaticivorans]